MFNTFVIFKDSKKRKTTFLKAHKSYNILLIHCLLLINYRKSKIKNQSDSMKAKVVQKLLHKMLPNILQGEKTWQT